MRPERHPRWRRGERGASAVEIAVLMPVFLTLIFMLVQAGLYYHAQNITQAVAQHTARTIRTPENPGQQYTRVPTEAELTARASQVAVDTWHALDKHATASRPSVTRANVDGFNQLVLTIEAKSVNLLPGLFPQLRVHATASGPIEVFKPSGTD